MVSILVNNSIEGGGRDSRICISLDVKRLFMIVIFPIGVRNLGAHIRISLYISQIFFSILMSVIFSMLSTSNVIPNDTNSLVHIKFLSKQNLSLLSPHTPILMILVFSMFTFKPDMH